MNAEYFLDTNILVCCFDSLIVAGALESQAPVLYSEDLQHDCCIGSLRIINPFL